MLDGEDHPFQSYGLCRPNFFFSGFDMLEVVRREFSYMLYVHEKLPSIMAEWITSFIYEILSTSHRLDHSDYWKEQEAVIVNAGGQYGTVKGFVHNG